MALRLHKTPDIFKKIYPDFLWTKKSENSIFLTFDDGPNPEITPWVLEQLNQFNAKATFFTIGENIVKYPELYQSIISNGHTIGNHTYNHLKGRKTDSNIYLTNYKKCQELVYAELFRPPYGSIKPSQAKTILKTSKIVMWDVLSYDWDHNLELEKAVIKIEKATKPGSIVVFHDSIKAAKNLRIMLPRLLQSWKSQGFEFEQL